MTETLSSLPSSVHTEITVLGAMLLDVAALDEATTKLRPSDFSLDSHQRIFRVMADLAKNTDAVDYVTVMDALSKRRELDAIGGPAYLAYLSEGVPRHPRVEDYVQIIKSKSRGRQGMQLCNRFQTEFAECDNPSELLANLQTEVLDIIHDDGQNDDPHVSAYSDVAWENVMRKAFSDDHMGLRYGCNKLDTHTWGMQPGEVTVVGARSGVGKSALMKQATVANCSRSIPVTLFSLEMTREQILNGLWAIVSGVEYRKVVRAQLMHPEERALLQSAYHAVKKWPLRIYDRSDLSIDQIVAYSRMNIRQFGTKLIAVDYAQNVEAEGKDERLKVANVSRKLTKMTKDEGNSLMLLSQLRKVPIENYGKPPTIADLRETGQLENDAHIVALLHRGWDEERSCMSNEGSILLPKIRNGNPGALQATFDPHTLTFQ